MEGLVMLAVLAVFGVPALMVLMFGWLLGLRRRVSDLESEMAVLRHRAAVAGEAAATRTAAEAPSEPTLSDWMRARTTGRATDDAPAQAPSSPSPSPSPSPASPRADAPPFASPAAATARDAGTRLPPPLPPRGPSTPPPHAPRPRMPQRSWADDVTGTVRRWFTEGNVPVKVGMLVLFAGVAALLKYASDQGLLRLPIELRLTGVALAAVAGLGFGWRQRESRRAFGLALQGGAVGVLLLVTFAAFKLYALLPAGAAFGTSVALVAGLCVLAVRQESLALAVLGVLAGFLAPIWLSTGSGNHVALFGYYAVLNAGIVAMAWRRPWRLLNLIGFAFTFGIGTVWGVLDYRPEDYASTQPFLALFFAMYVAIPLLYATAKGPSQSRVFDGSLVFGTPLVAFALQAALLRDDRMALAFCALGIAALYALLAASLRRREAFAQLVAPYAVLAVGFATLAVPLALSARATAAIFALEGAGLVWLGLRQGRVLPQAAGLALQAAALVAFASAFDGDATGPALLNGPWMTALLIAIGGFATALAARRHGQDGLAVVACLWGLAWWMGAGLWEIDRSLPPSMALDAALLLVLGTGLVASEIDRRMPAGLLRAVATAALLLPIAFAAWQADDRGQPLAGLGLAAWAAALVVGWRVLSALAAGASAARPWAHLGWLASLGLVASLSLLDLARRSALGDGWHYAAAALPLLALGALARLRPGAIAWPFDEAFEGWRNLLESGLAMVFAAFFLIGLLHAGAPAPLPYLPLLNPVDLVQLAGLLLVAHAVGTDRRARALLAGAGFALATAAALRAAHHWGDVPWSASMFSTGLVQTTLTVLWSVIGMAAWVAGSRGQRRVLWQAGAVLMAVVLAKLVLVDRQYLGNLLGIGSFIAFGLLCTAVGYLAPVPPRGAEARA